MGFYDYCTLTGYLGGPVVGAALVGSLGAGNNTQGAMLSFFVIAGLLALSALTLHIFVPGTGKAAIGFSDLKGHKILDTKELRNVFKVKEVRLMFPIWLILATLIGLAIVYLPRILENRLSTADLQGGNEYFFIAMFFLAGALALGLFQPFWGKISDKVGRLPVMVWGVISVLGVVLILGFWGNSVYDTDIYKSTWGVNVLLAIPVVIFGVGAGAFIPAALGLMADK